MAKKEDIWKVTDFKQERIRDYNVSEMEGLLNSKKIDLSSCQLRLARTLYTNFYRARLQDAYGENAGQILIVPGLPLDRSQLPGNAPIADPFLLVIVEDADINRNNVINFEECVSRAVLKKFSTETGVFSHCEFYYPSPAFYFAQEE